jgi:hypothetical protein
MRRLDDVAYTNGVIQESMYYQVLNKFKVRLSYDFTNILPPPLYNVQTGKCL